MRRARAVRRLRARAVSRASATARAHVRLRCSGVCAAARRGAQAWHRPSHLREELAYRLDLDSARAILQRSKQGKRLLDFLIGVNLQHPLRHNPHKLIKLDLREDRRRARPAVNHGASDARAIGAQSWAKRRAIASEAARSRGRSGARSRAKRRAIMGGGRRSPSSHTPDGGVAGAHAPATGRYGAFAGRLRRYVGVRACHARCALRVARLASRVSRASRLACARVRAHHPVAVDVDTGDDPLDLLLSLRAAQIAHHVPELVRLDVPVTIAVCQRPRRHHRRSAQSGAPQQPRRAMSRGAHAAAEQRGCARTRAGGGVRRAECAECAARARRPSPDGLPRRQKAAAPGGGGGGGPAAAARRPERAREPAGRGAPNFLNAPAISTSWWGVSSGSHGFECDTCLTARADMHKSPREQPRREPLVSSGERLRPAGHAAAGRASAGGGVLGGTKRVLKMSGIIVPASGSTFVRCRGSFEVQPPIASLMSGSAAQRRRGRLVDGRCAVHSAPHHLPQGGGDRQAARPPGPSQTQGNSHGRRAGRTAREAKATTAPLGWRPCASKAPQRKRSEYLLPCTFYFIWGKVK